jgi:hypothetical protein
VSAPSLEVALDALGIPCDVEAHDRLAVVIPRGDVSALADAGPRRQVIRLARDHGFTHIALELVASPRAAEGAAANVAPAAPRATLHRD